MGVLSRLPLFPKHNRVVSPQEKAEGWAQEVRETVANETRALLQERRRGGNPDLLQPSLEFADRNIQAIARAVNAFAERYQTPGIACRAGCANCCHFRVSILSVEAIGIAKHLRANRTPDEVEAILQAVRDYADTIASLPVEERIRYRLACPFLGEDMACSIYPARPFACRMHHSRSREACESLDQAVPVIEEFVDATVPIMEGVHIGCDESDVMSGELEFIPAVRIALEDDQAEAKWLAGQDAFSGARDSFLRAYVDENIAPLRST